MARLGWLGVSLRWAGSLAMALMTLVALIAMRRMARPVFGTALRLLRTWTAFADAIQLPNRRPQRFNLTFLGIFLDLGFFECFDGLFHFDQKRFEVSVDLLHLFNRLANGRCGIGPATGNL